MHNHEITLCRVMTAQKERCLEAKFILKNKHKIKTHIKKLKKCWISAVIISVFPATVRSDSLIRPMFFFLQSALPPLFFPTPLSKSHSFHKWKRWKMSGWQEEGWRRQNLRCFTVVTDLEESFLYFPIVESLYVYFMDELYSNSRCEMQDLSVFSIVSLNSLLSDTKMWKCVKFYILLQHVSITAKIIRFKMSIDIK